MLELISDPKLYLLFVAAYVVGFVDTEDPSGTKRRWENLSGASFWGAVLLAVYLCVAHGLWAGSIGLLASWAVGVAGVRRGMIAQRNLLWESLLWTVPFEQLVAAPARGPVFAAGFTPRRKSPRRAARQWQWPAIADLFPLRGRPLAILGVGVDLAVCVLVVSGLALLLR